MVELRRSVLEKAKKQVKIPSQNPMINWNPLFGGTEFAETTYYDPTEEPTEINYNSWCLRSLPVRKSIFQVPLFCSYNATFSDLTWQKLLIPKISFLSNYVCSQDLTQSPTEAPTKMPVPEWVLDDDAVRIVKLKYSTVLLIITPPLNKTPKSEICPESQNNKTPDLRFEIWNLKILRPPDSILARRRRKKIGIFGAN